MAGKIPISVKNILFIDLETVACVEEYDLLEEPQKLLWHKKASNFGKETLEEVRAFFTERAAIYAEFGKIVVIGLGYITFNDHGAAEMRVHTLSGHDERKLLQQFNSVIKAYFPQPTLQLCAHNGKEFDFPYICRRMLVQGIDLPAVLKIQGKKPWEVNHLDTMEMWKFGDRKSFTSLDLLANIFGINSSKTLMDGSQVHAYYYQEDALADIAAYCAQDVVVLAQIYLKLNNWVVIMEENIIFA